MADTRTLAWFTYFLSSIIIDASYIKETIMRTIEASEISKTVGDLFLSACRMPGRDVV